MTTGARGSTGSAKKPQDIADGWFYIAENKTGAACVVCGQPLPVRAGRGRPRVICSEACRRVRSRQAAGLQRLDKGLCRWCHRKPIPPGRGSSRYCSLDCRTSARAHLHRHPALDRTELGRCHACHKVCQGPGRPTPTCTQCAGRDGRRRRGTRQTRR
jgi:hypothetical protein